MSESIISVSMLKFCALGGIFVARLQINIDQFLFSYDIVICSGYTAFSTTETIVLSLYTII